MCTQIVLSGSEGFDASVIVWNGMEVRDLKQMY